MPFPRSPGVPLSPTPIRGQAGSLHRGRRQKGMARPLARSLLVLLLSQAQAVCVAGERPGPEPMGERVKATEPGPEGQTRPVERMGAAESVYSVVASDPETG